MHSYFADIFDRHLLLELAGGRSFERGEDYYRRGAVRAFTEYEGTLTARVTGTYEYRVRFRAEVNNGLSYSCSCPVGEDGLFCKHCVAAGLAWLEEGAGKRRPEESEERGLSMEELGSFLEEQDSDVLVRMLMEQALEDERLYGRLLTWAARARPEGANLATFRKVIDEAFYGGDLPDYGSVERFARGVVDVVESIAKLLRDGHAQETIELCEYALKAAEGAMDYDVEGYLSGALEGLEEIHHAACKEARVDPKALARRLFDWEVGGHYDTFFDAANTYADVLQEEGLAEYKRLAEERWAQVSVLGPGEKDPQGHFGKRSRITYVMETLARQEEGDVEKLVAVISRDLSGPRQYLRIASIYAEAGQSEKALEWAEEAMWVFPDNRHPGLREFVAWQYHRRGRHEEGTQFIWPHFAKSPQLESYKELKKHAERGGLWEQWRNKALEFLREELARRKEDSKQGYLSLPVDHSELVRIFLSEGDVEAAWREAQEGGCSESLWLELAARREEEHPEETLAIYESRIEPLIAQTNNAAYKEACELLAKVGALMHRLDREPEFKEYLKLLRTEYKRKRNFMKLLERMT